MAKFNKFDNHSSDRSFKSDDYRERKQKSKARDLDRKSKGNKREMAWKQCLSKDN